MTTKKPQKKATAPLAEDHGDDFAYVDPAIAAAQAGEPVEFVVEITE